MNHTHRSPELGSTSQRQIDMYRATTRAEEGK
jgi:hypothetical protein